MTDTSEAWLRLTLRPLGWGTPTKQREKLALKRLRRSYGFACEVEEEVTEDQAWRDLLFDRFWKSSPPPHPAGMVLRQSAQRLPGQDLCRVGWTRSTTTGAEVWYRFGEGKTFLEALRDYSKRLPLWMTAGVPAVAN